MNEPDLEKTEYMLQFLSIPCSVTKSEKRGVLRNHKSNEKNEKIRETKRRNNKLVSHQKKVINETKVIKYKQMDPIKKKVLNESKLLKSKQIDAIKKKVLNESKVLRYKQMDPIKKKVLNESKLLKFKQMDPMIKNILNESKVLKYKDMDPFHKNAFREKRATSFKASVKDPYRKRNRQEVE